MKKQKFPEIKLVIHLNKMNDLQKSSLAKFLDFYGIESELEESK